SQTKFNDAASRAPPAFFGRSIPARDLPACDLFPTTASSRLRDHVAAGGFLRAGAETYSRLVPVARARGGSNTGTTLDLHGHVSRFTRAPVPPHRPPSRSAFPQEKLNAG